MNKEKVLQYKRSLATVLPLIYMVLGVGCIWWALMNIGVNTTHSNSAYRSPSSSSTTIMVKQKEISLSDYDFDSTELEHPSDVLNHGKNLYPSYPEEGDDIGSLSIPVLNQKLDIRQGTGAAEMKKGVGHFIQSVMPGEANNCVLSGQRDSVFKELDKLKIGDQLIVKTSAGTYTYEINNIRIVDKENKIVILPSDHAVLTLSTCYPFYVVDNAPNRYVLTADLVISK